MINILYVLFEFYFGGLENGIVNLINFSSEKFNHHICCLRKKGSLAKRITKNVQFHELNMRYGNDLTLPFKIAKIINNNNINIVRAFNEEPFIYSFLPSKLFHTPIIYYNGGRTFPEKFPRFLIEKFMAKYTNNIVVPSLELKHYMVEQIGLNCNSINVIYNGIDVVRFKNSNIDHYRIKRDIGIPEDAVVIGTIGRLVDQKDLPTFLNIAKRILLNSENYYFLVVGDGHLRSDLKHMAKDMSIDNRVKFLGIRNDIENIYKILDIFLLTSKWEGMSNVLLEAMANRIPVFATNVEGVRQIITDGKDGFIFNIGDVEGFASKILSLDKSKANIIGNNGYKKVSENFTIKNMVRQYEKLYLKICNEKYSTF